MKDEILTHLHDMRQAALAIRAFVVHGYDGVDDRIVWGIIEEDLDRLLEDVNTLLA